MPKRAAGIYVRISDDRVGAGLGVERQEQDCRKLAKRLGWQVLEVYTDNDLSAYGRSKRAKPRPAYEALKADIRSGRIAGVIAWHTDRLHRNPRELEDFIDVCAEQVPVETVQAGVIDLRTPAGQAVARTLCAWAFYESAHKSERVKAKYVQLAEAGEVGNGGFRPFGYSADRMSIEEDEAELLRWAYAQLISGRSLRSIVVDLNDRGSRSTQGSPWTLQALRYNLRSPRNTGLREHRKVIVGEAKWPAIVDRDTWKLAQDILLDPARRRTYASGQVVTNARKHLLTGFLWCGRCGGKLGPRSAGGSAQRFGCLPSKDGGCGGSNVGAEVVEKHVTALLLAKLERDAAFEQEDPPDWTGLILAEIARDEKRLEKLAAAFADDDDANPLELRAAGARIRTRIADKRAELARMTVQARVRDPLVVRDAWPDYDLQQRRQVVDLLIERIIVGPGTPGRFDPNRLAITWR